MAINENILGNAFREASEPITEDDYIDVTESTDEEDYSEDPEEIEEESAEPEDVEDEDEVEEVGFDYASWNPDSWSGRPEDLPPSLLQTYKTMQGGYTKKMQGLSDRERQLLAREQQLNVLIQKMEQSLQTREAESDPEPPYPTEDMAPDQQRQAFAAWTKWNARQELKQAQNSGKFGNPQDIAQVKEEMEVRNRIAYLQSKPEWGEEMDVAMSDIVKANPIWNSYLGTNEGIDVLYEYTKSQMELSKLREKAADLESAKIRRAAGSAKRRTPKAKTKSQAIDTFGDALEGLDPMQKIGKIFELERE